MRAGSWVDGLGTRGNGLHGAVTALCRAWAAAALHACCSQYGSTGMLAIGSMPSQAADVCAAIWHVACAISHEGCPEVGSYALQRLGFSDTLGAFCAGVLLSETNFRTQVWPACLMVQMLNAACSLHCKCCPMRLNPSNCLVARLPISSGPTSLAWSK